MCKCTGIFTYSQTATNGNLDLVNAIRLDDNRIARGIVGNAIIIAEGSASIATGCGIMVATLSEDVLAMDKILCSGGLSCN